MLGIIVVICLVLLVIKKSRRKHTHQTTHQFTYQRLEGELMHMICVIHDGEPGKPIDPWELSKAKHSLLTALSIYRGLPVLRATGLERDALLATLLWEVGIQGGVMGQTAWGVRQDLSRL